MRQNKNEPVEVDLFVDPVELTKIEKNLLSEFIKKDKQKNKSYTKKSSSQKYQLT
jgi:hypothetical protein